MIKKLIYSFSTSNPYKVLGINKGSTSQEIKMAYYKLAQQYHPDKNPSKDAGKMFTQVNNAYEILSDENKRRMFDSCGVQDDSHQEAQGFDDYDEEFRKGSTKKRKQQKASYYSKFHTAEYETIFSEFEKFYQQRHGKQKAYYAKRKGEDIKLKLNLTFKESVFGGKRALSYSRIRSCETCKGSRCAPNTTAQKCYSCGGSGWLFYTDKGSQMEVKCTNCDGWGKVVRDTCKTCEGKGVVERDFDVEIDLPKGIQNGTIIRQSRCGHASIYAGEPGDLLIEVDVQEDQTLRRDGHNIISEVGLSVSEMVLGCKKQVQTIWGALEISIPAHQQPKTKLQIPQYGIQYGQSQWKKGDHILILNLQIPESVSEQAKQLYYELYKHLGK